MSEAQMQAAVPEWDLADRMRKALRISGSSVQEIADYLGVAPTTVSTWINGRNRPSPSTIRLWAMRCGVSHEWLIGAGSRRAPIRSAGENYPDAWGLCMCPCCCFNGGSSPDGYCQACRDGKHGRPVNLYRSGLGLAA